jgi:hypothetical protein
MPFEPAMPAMPANRPICGSTTLPPFAHTRHDVVGGAEPSPGGHSTRVQRVTLALLPPDHAGRAGLPGRPVPRDPRDSRDNGSACSIRWSCPRHSQDDRARPRCAQPGVRSHHPELALFSFTTPSVFVPCGPDACSTLHVSCLPFPSLCGIPRLSFPRRRTWPSFPRPLPIFLPLFRKQS